MARSRSFGERIAASFAVVALLAVVTSASAIYAVRIVTSSKDRVITVNASRLIDVASMRAARERRAKHVRSFLLSGDERFVVQMQEARDELLQHIGALATAPLDDEDRKNIESVASANSNMQSAWDAAISMRRTGMSIPEIMPHFEKSGSIVQDLDARMNALFDHEAKLLEKATDTAGEIGSSAVRVLVAEAILAIAAAALFTLLLGRMLKRQLRPAVDTIQTSAADLSSAARQQASSSRELAATTVEIATTTRELLAMSRQISASARRAAQTAEEAGERAKSGDLAMEHAKEAISGIQRQVAVIVDRMRSLGSKSQRVGGILEVINDLAEQTNILAINATIESASAGEAGKRFAVVASEIRRLADRVGDSAREIHGLLEEIRRAASATVAATDDGSKAVASGTAEFSEVLSTFKHITERATVTAEVAREIELSIQQQTSAVEQVNHAISEVAYATKETEASCLVTLETSSQLAAISDKLAELVQAETKKNAEAKSDQAS